MKSISFVIPNYNAESTVDKTIDSILKQKYKGTVEIIVIDDKSKDNSLKVLSKFKKYKNFKLIQNKENIGLAKSLNKAISLSKYDLISIIWCDCVLVGDNWLKLMVEKFDSDKSICCVRSNLFLPKEIWKRYDFWSKIETLEEYVRGVNKIKFGRPTLFDKKKVLEVGGYNTKTYRIAGEDTDLRLKLKKKGYKSLLAETDMVHMHGFHKRSLFEHLIKKAFPLAEASGVLFRKHLFLNNPYRNALIYTIIYLLAVIPNFLQPLFLVIVALMLIIYTLKVLKYINDVKVILVPFYKFFKDIISLIGFWKGFITKKQEF